MMLPWKKLPKKEVDPEREDQLKEQMEKGDMGAMVMAAFLTIFLPCVLVLLGLAGLVLLLFHAL